MRDLKTSNREAELKAIPRVGSGDWLGIRRTRNNALTIYQRVSIVLMLARASIEACHARPEVVMSAEPA